jgi:hypothetical protein
MTIIIAKIVLGAKNSRTVVSSAMKRVKPQLLEHADAASIDCVVKGVSTTGCFHIVRSLRALMVRVD